MSEGVQEGLQALAGKRIFIVGGTSGIGLSAALACQRAGAHLVIAGREDEHAERAARALGSATPLLTGDAADSELAKRGVAEAVKQFGGLDGLYHVAGGSGRRWGDGPLDRLTVEGWRQTLRLNLDSVFYSNQAAVEWFLRQQTGGSVVNLSSVLAYSPSSANFATHAYATAKAGIIGLTRACASYYAAENIRFNVIAPGLVETPMARRTVEDSSLRAMVAAKQPLDGGRIGQPADLDAAAVLLLSNAGRFMTGQVLAIDGGWSVTDLSHAAKEEGA